MRTGMIRWEWEGNGNKKVIPAHLYSPVATALWRPSNLKCVLWKLSKINHKTIEPVIVYEI